MSDALPIYSTAEARFERSVDVIVKRDIDRAESDADAARIALKVLNDQAADLYEAALKVFEDHPVYQAARDHDRASIRDHLQDGISDLFFDARSRIEDDLEEAEVAAARAERRGM